MFIDASALVAVLNRESGADKIEQALLAWEGRLFYSDIVLFEGTQAIARIMAIADKTTLRQNPQLLISAWHRVFGFLQDLGAHYVPITFDIGVKAQNASRRYGKYVGHAAQLNLGDCYSYAMAKALAVPLLYVGSDFSETDLR